MRKAFIPILLWGILGLSVPTWADPLSVTSGGYSVSSGEDGYWNLFGSGFALNGSGLGDVLPFWSCLSCPVGAPVNMDARLELGARSTAGSATWGSSSYEEVYWTGDLFFDAGTATAGIGNVETSPFTFTGNLSAFADEARTTLLFSTALTGAGTATVTFALFPSPPTGAEVLRVAYAFEADAAPVPEPATMLLLGSGLSGLAIARRRRKSDR